MEYLEDTNTLSFQIYKKTQSYKFQVGLDKMNNQKELEHTVTGWYFKKLDPDFLHISSTMGPYATKKECKEARDEAKKKFIAHSRGYIGGTD